MTESSPSARSVRRRVVFVLVMLALCVGAAWWLGPGGERAPGARAARVDEPAPHQQEPQVSLGPQGSQEPQGRRAERARRAPPVSPEPPPESEPAEPVHANRVVVSVRDERDAPVPGVVIVVADLDGRTTTAETNTAGRAALDAAARPERVHVRLPPALRLVYLPVETLPVAGRGRVDVALRRGVALRARVLRPDGSPLPNAHVAVSERPSGRGLDQALTDEDGRFAVLLAPGTVGDARLVGVARGTDDQIRAGRLQLESPWEGRWTGLEPLSTPEAEHTLRALPVARADLRVRVETPDGQPVPAARVTTRIGNWTAIGDPVETDAEGRAVLRDVPVRERRVVVDLAAAAAAAWVAPDPVRALPGGEEVVVTLRPAARIGGRVERDDGVAVSWCAVEVWHGEDRIASATSAADGSFEVALPADAPAPLTVRARTYDRDRRMYSGETPEAWPGAADIVVRITRDAE